MPATAREDRVWTEQSLTELLLRLHHTDWSVHRQASEDNVSNYTDVVNSYIIDYINDTVQRMVRVYPNQHPWLNGEVHAALKARNAAFRARDMGTTQAHLQRTIRKAKK